MHIKGRLKDRVKVTEIAENILKIIIALLLPFVINLPPSKLPVTTPNIAELLMIVL